MIKQKSIKVNFIMNSLLTMSSFIFPLITFPYAARVLHPAGTGKVAFATSIIFYFSIFTQMGIPTYGIHACAKVRENKAALTQTAQELLLINLIASIIAYIVLGISILSFDTFYKNKELLAVLSMSVMLNTIGMEWLYKALEKYTYITVRSLAFKVISLILMFLLVHDSGDIIIYGFITIFASSASNILNFISVRNHISVKPADKYDLKRHLKPVFVFFAMACATTIYTNLDTVMLGFMTSDEEVGYYNTAIKVKTILVSVVTSLGTVLLPRVSYFIQNKRFNEFGVIIEKTLNFIFMLSLPLTVYFVFYSKWVVLLLAGQDYLPAVEPMQIILLTLPLIGVSSLLGYEILVPMGREKVFLYSVLSGAVVDTVLNAIFIPRLGTSGAALATLIAEIVVLVVLLWNLKCSITGILKKIPYDKIGISLIVSILTSYIVSKFTVIPLSMIIMTGTVFFGTYLGALIVMKEELTRSIVKFDILGKMIKKLLKKE